MVVELVDRRVLRVQDVVKKMKQDYHEEREAILWGRSNFLWSEKWSSGFASSSEV